MVSRPVLASTSTSARAPDIYLAATGTVSFFNTATTVNDCRRREVRPRDVFHQPFNADVFIIDIRQTTVDDFRKVLRRDVVAIPTAIPEEPFTSRLGFGCMTSGIFPCRHNYQRNRPSLFEIGHQFMGNFRQTDFRITHCRRRVAVDGTEVTLTVYQHVTQRMAAPYGRSCHKPPSHHGDGIYRLRHQRHGQIFIGFVPVIA